MSLPSDLHNLLEACPTALLNWCPDGPQIWVNAVARALAPGVGTDGWVQWLSGVEPLLTHVSTPSASSLELEWELPDQSQVVRIQVKPATESGWLLGLTPLGELRRTQADVGRLQELLDVARDFGRLGFWERDAKTLKGQWDRKIRSFRDLTDESPAPSFEDSLEQVAASDRIALDQAFRSSLLQPGTYSHRFSLRTRDGTLRRVHSQWRVKADGDGLPARAVGLLLDDTESLALTGAATAPEFQLALAVDLGHIALWRHDFASQRVHYNAQAWTVLGLPPRADGLSLDEVRAFIHPDDLPDVVASAQHALRNDGPTDMEARYRRADGSWRQVLTRRVVQRDAAGQPVAFLGVAMDVTERRDTALALRSAAERVALVTRSAGLATWEIDLLTGEEFWDEQMWLLRGQQPPSAPGAMATAERVQCLHPDDREAAIERYRRARTEHNSLEYEFRVVWPDGQVRWLAARSKTLCDEQRRPLRRMGVNWDITDARNAAALRQEAEAVRRESAAKSRFMARVSHELRTPMNAVLGFTQLLLAEQQAHASGQGAPEASRRERLGHVLAAGQHLLRLINDLLDLTGLESGDLPIILESVDLAQVLNDCLPMIEPALHARRIELQHQVPTLAVLADATRLRQVLLNLLSNAAKYNGEQRCVRVRAWPEGSWVHIRISNTGQGMEAEQLRALFEPFTRLGTESTLIEGSGIGLSIAKTLAERMGGRLEAFSDPGQGSSFTLSLRVADQQAQANGQRVAAPPPHPQPLAHPVGPPQRNADPDTAPAPARTKSTALRKVLYVEDNPVNALIVSELLALRPQWQLHVSADGQSGLRWATDELPDLVLLDMQLPDMDGLEVLRRLRAAPATAHIPCFALSANAMPTDIECALRAGAADYWTKPLEFASFIAALDRLFGDPTSPEPGPPEGP